MMPLLLPVYTVVNMVSVSPEVISSRDGLLGFVKLLILTATLLYLLFAGIVIRQIGLMESTLGTTFAPQLRLLGYIHFAISLTVFVLFLMLL